MAVSTGAAILGGSLFSAGSSYFGSQASSEASADASKEATKATLEATLATLGEIKYQFDYSQAALAQGRQLEYNAQNAFGSMLGINGTGTGSSGSQPIKMNNQPFDDSPAVRSGREYTPSPQSIKGEAPRPATLNGKQGLTTTDPRADRQYIKAGMRGAGDPNVRSEYPGGYDPNVQNRSPRGFGQYVESIGPGSDDPNIRSEYQRGDPSSQSKAVRVVGRGGAELAGELRSRPPPVTTDHRGNVVEQYPQPLADNQVNDRFGNTQTFGATNTDFQPNVGARGFVDPNVDPTRMAGDSIEDDPYYNYVTGSRIAGETFGEDPYARRVMNTERVGANYSDDPYFQSVQNSGIAGDTFQESPGYQFALEQGEQGLERRNSAGGNYGGRALKEASRYNTGMANQEYYNWANLRGMDLSREDAAYTDYQNLRAGDLNRQDATYDQWVATRGADLSRSDAAYRNYQGREEYDINRSDIAYQNYMNNLRGAAGLGENIPATVASSQSAGSQAAGAYTNQGNALTNIYQTQGRNEIDAIQQRYGGFNDAVQGGIKNYLTYDQLNQ